MEKTAPPAADAMLIEFDTPFVGDDIYTRANAGEVFPQLLSPLTWTLLGPGIERGFMRCMAHDFAAIAPQDDGYRACGRMAGRLHLNLSVFRTVAERVPGSSAHDLDIQYFGDAVANGLPAHPDEEVPLRTSLRCTIAALRTMAGFKRRVQRETTRVRDAEAERNVLLSNGLSAGDLLEAARAQVTLYADLFGTHVTARALTSSAVSQATHVLARGGVPADTAIQTISNLPDLESAKPTRALSEIAADLREPELREELSRGLTWRDLETSALTGAERLRDALRDFISNYGHRGVNELDPTSPVWGTHPDTVLSLLGRILSAAPGRRAEASPGPLPRGLAGLFVRQARAAIRRAEITKNNITRASHNIRLLLDAALDQLDDTLPRDRALALTFDELLEVANGAPVPTGPITRRLGEIEEALTVEPAEWSVHHVALVGGEADEAVSEIVGLAGSNGAAIGRARVMRSVDDAFEDGDVLIAASTDTAWTPLFVAASAVVTDTGGPLSHATIIARELGIPAVVNTKTATRDLGDGDLIEVDGSSGIVRLLERNEQ